MIGVLALCRLPHIAPENHRGCSVAALFSLSGAPVIGRANIHLLSVSQSLGRALANMVRNVVVRLVSQSPSFVGLPCSEVLVLAVVSAGCNL